MARVNRLNKARNFQNAFQNVGARPEGARTADDGVDPFSRRKTRLVNYWTTNKQKGAGAGASRVQRVSPFASDTNFMELSRVLAYMLHCLPMRSQLIIQYPPLYSLCTMYISPSESCTSTAHGARTAAQAWETLTQ